MQHWKPAHLVELGRGAEQAGKGPVIRQGLVEVVHGNVHAILVQLVSQMRQGQCLSGKHKLEPGIRHLRPPLYSSLVYAALQFPCLCAVTAEVTTAARERCKSTGLVCNTSKIAQSNGQADVLPACNQCPPGGRGWVQQGCYSRRYWRYAGSSAAP